MKDVLNMKLGLPLPEWFLAAIELHLAYPAACDVAHSTPVSDNASRVARRDGSSHGDRT